MKRIFKWFKVIEGSDSLINVTTILLALFGLVMAVSASMTASDNSIQLLIYATVKQLIYFIISYFGMVFASRLFNYKLVKNLIMPLSLVMIILLLITLLFPETGGAKAWIRLGFGPMQFTLQPSEFAKVTTILLVSMFFGEIPLNTQRTSGEIIKPVLLVIIIQAFIILKPQNDLGSAIVLVLLALFVAFIPSHPKLRQTQNILIILTVLGFGFSIFLMSNTGISMIEKTGILQGYQMNRFTDYANPFSNFTGSGYQLAGSLVAFARGNMFGVGLGQSIQKYGYLPEARTDFILPLIAEELGFVGVFVLMTLYAILLWRLTYFALKVKGERDKMILMGAVIYMFLHILLNVGGVSVFIPLTGVPLLLISSGGSSTMAIMLLIGICQNIISRYKMELVHENS